MSLIQLADLPGIQGKVTRFSPLIERGDRTMRVEVDLFNESEADYQRLQVRMVAAGMAPLGQFDLLSLLSAARVGQAVTHQHRKGCADALPVRPKILGSGRADYRLLPGMTGYMRLNLNKFTQACLLPSSAVFTKGGKTYILVVRDGVSRMVPVKVQVNDGRLAKIIVGGQGGAAELFRDLTDREEVIAHRQLEIGDGQRVKSTLVNW